MNKETDRWRRAMRGCLATLALLLLVQPALGEDPPSAAVPPGSVTKEILEAKIKEVEAATGVKEQAKAKLLELYRKALSNLQTASANAQAADDFQQEAETAPTQVQTLREGLDEAAATPPEDTLDVDPSASLRQLEQLLQKEKADFAAVDARHADFDKRLDEEAGRPAPIRQRLTEAKAEQDEVATQLKLPPPADDGPATLEARRWALETDLDALSIEIKMLDQELLSQPARVDLLHAKRDKAAASVRWIGKRVELLEELVNRQRQVEATQARAEAAETRREAEGAQELVVELAEQNAALTEELVQAASQLNDMAGQAERADKLARRIEIQFKSAKDTVAIGGLSRELGQMLQRQRQSLPDLRDYRRAVTEREDKAVQIGVRRLRHWEEETTLQDLDDYLDAVVAGAYFGNAAEDTPDLRRQLRELAGNRKSLLEKATAADDIYLRKLGELESAQRRLLDAIADYDSFLDRQMLWVRSTPLFQLDQFGPMWDQMGRVLSPDGWDQVARTLVYQAIRSPVFALLALMLAVSLWGRRRLIEVIQAQSTKLGKPTTDHFGYTLLVVALSFLAAAAWPLVMAVVGWKLKVSVEATDFTTALGTALLVAAPQFLYLRALRVICVPDGLAAAHFRWPESSLRLLRSELDHLTWIFLPAILLTMIASALDPLDYGGPIGRISFMIAVASLAVAFARLLHPKRGGVSEVYTRGGRDGPSGACTGSGIRWSCSIRWRWGSCP